MSNPVVPAGWYADPNDAARLRWWDGMNWQDHFAPAPPAMPVATPPVGPAANIPAPSTSGVPQGKPAPDTRNSVPLVDYARDIGARFSAKAKRPANPVPIQTNSQANFGGDPRIQAGSWNADGAVPTEPDANYLGSDKAKPKKKSKMFLVGLIIFLIGLSGLIIGIPEAIGGPVSATASGQVTKIQPGTHNQCIPTVEFQVQGETHTTRPDSFATCIWEVGDPTEVSYTVSSGGTVAQLGAAPEARTTVAGGFMMLVVGFILMIVGLAPVLLRGGSIAGWAYLVHRDQRRK